VIVTLMFPSVPKRVKGGCVCSFEKSGSVHRFYEIKHFIVFKKLIEIIHRWNLKVINHQEGVFF